MRPDFSEEVPTTDELRTMWLNLKIRPVSELSQTATQLIEEVSKTHVNGGMKIHKFHVDDSTNALQWFATRNRLNEIYFVENVIQRPELEQYRASLDITLDNLECTTHDYSTDIFDLSATLAKTLFFGGAYENTDRTSAWDIGTKFTNVEFQNRFDEVVSFTISVSTAKWFYNIAWDQSLLLFDKRGNTMMLIDVTDTD